MKCGLADEISARHTVDATRDTHAFHLDSTWALKRISAVSILY